MLYREDHNKTVRSSIICNLLVHNYTFNTLLLNDAQCVFSVKWRIRCLGPGSMGSYRPYMFCEGAAAYCNCLNDDIRIVAVVEKSPTSYLILVLYASSIIIDTTFTCTSLNYKMQKGFNGKM